MSPFEPASLHSNRDNSGNRGSSVPCSGCGDKLEDKAADRSAGFDLHGEMMFVGRKPDFERRPSAAHDTFQAAHIGDDQQGVIDVALDRHRLPAGHDRLGIDHMFPVRDRDFEHIAGIIQGWPVKPGSSLVRNPLAKPSRLNVESRSR